MDITRRSFLKTSLGAAVAMNFPGAMGSYAFAGPSRKVREFRLTASRTSIRLGSSPEFRAWTYNGQVPRDRKFE